MVTLGYVSGFPNDLENFRDAFEMFPTWDCVFEGWWGGVHEQICLF